MRPIDEPLTMPDTRTTSPDPDNCPWTDVLYQRSAGPDHCYYSESRWCVRPEPEGDPVEETDESAPRPSHSARPGEAA